MRSSPEVTFGRAIRHQWPLDPEIVYLNHGTVGVTPTVVLDTQEAIRRQIEASEATANRLRDTLLFDYRIEVPIFTWHDRLWARLSAQVYNEHEDFERLAEAVEIEAATG